MIGAYPPNGKYDLCRGSKAEHAKALASIPKVPLPATDPVFGPKGPLLALWRGMIVRLARVLGQPPSRSTSMRATRTCTTG